MDAVVQPDGGAAEAKQAGRRKTVVELAAAALARSAKAASPLPDTPTSVIERPPSSPSSAASSVLGASHDGSVLPASGAVVPAPPPRPLLLHRKSILVSFRRRRSVQPCAGQLPPAHPNTPRQHALAVVTLALFFGAAAFLPVLLGVAALAALVLRSALAAAFLALFAGLAALPAGSKSQAFRHSRVWDAWRRYFRLRASVPALPYVDADKNYMVVMVPHSVFPMGTWLNAGITDAPFGGMPSRVEAVVADVLLRLPLYKHLFAWIGCHPADATTVRRLLRDRSVAICPEGIAGIFHASSRGDADERVFLKARRGFVRVAIQAGTPLLPVYHIGASQLLRFVGLPRLSRRLRASVGLWCGVAGTPMPHQHDVLTVVGEPIAVEQCDDPTPEMVDAAHARFCDALTALFDAHKHLLGPEWEGKKLKIV